MKSKNTYRLYKYRPLYEGENPYPFTEQIFRKNELWYSLPKDFNAPFDCNLRLHTRGSTDDDWIQHLRGIPNKTPEEVQATELAIKRRSWRNNEGFQNIGQMRHEETYRKSSVLCFSKIGNSIPMFSYYGDSHRGIALEFEFSEDDLPCAVDYRAPNGYPYAGKIVFADVKYPENYPELNFHRLSRTAQGRLDMITNMIFTKHHEWEHEAEFRIFRHRLSAGLAKFERTQLKRIIFGCNTSINDEKLVKDWLKNWPNEVKFAKCYQSDTSFELDIRDIDKP